MYFSAEEDASSSSESGFPVTPQSPFPDVHSGSSDSPNLSKGDKSPSLYMNNSDVSQVDATVVEMRSDSTSSDSTLSYLSIDTDVDDTLSGGIPEEFSMVDLHSQVQSLLE